MVLYSKFLYGSQFSGEKSDLKIRYLVTKILSERGVSFFWDTLYMVNFKLAIYLSVVDGVVLTVIIRPISVFN